MLHDIAQDPIIRGDKVSRWCSQDNCPSSGANSGVNDHQVDCSLREELIGGAQDKGRLEDILRLDGVTDINYLCLRIDAKDDPFRGGNIGISQTEVSGQGYYGAHNSSYGTFRVTMEVMIKSTTSMMVS